MINSHLFSMQPGIYAVNGGFINSLKFWTHRGYLELDIGYNHESDLGMAQISWFKGSANKFLAASGPDSSIIMQEDKILYYYDGNIAVPMRLQPRGSHWYMRAYGELSWMSAVLKAECERLEIPEVMTASCPNDTENASESPLRPL